MQNAKCKKDFAGTQRRGEGIAVHPLPANLRGLRFEF
jgi:hypothetical protein